MRLAARQGVGAAREAQVGEAHIVQKAQTGHDFAHHFVGNVGLATFELQVLEVGLGIGQRQTAELVNVERIGAGAQQHVASFAAQARAFAIGAGAVRAVAGQLLAHHGGVGLAVAPIHVGQDAFKGVATGFLFALGIQIGEGNHRVARAIQHHVLHRIGQVFKRGFGVEVVMLRQRIDQPKVMRVAAVPTLDGAARQAQRGERHHPLGVDKILQAQAVATGASAHGRVEGKQPGLHGVHGEVALRASQMRLEVGVVAIVDVVQAHPPLRQVQGGFQALCQALAQVGAHAQAVDHHIHPDGCAHGAEAGVVGAFNQLAIHTKTHKALGDVARQQVGHRAVEGVMHWGQHQQSLAFGPAQHGVHHLGHGVGGQRLAVVGAMRRACARHEQAQVVVNFGDGAHRGAGVVVGGLLLNGNGGRQTFDQVDIGFVEAIQKLARVGRQAFHVSALALGIQGVEGQRRLARPRQTGDDHQLVAGQIHIDVGQVVGARSPHRNLVGFAKAGGTNLVAEVGAICGGVQSIAPRKGNRPS